MYLIKTDSDGYSLPMGINKINEKNIELTANPNPFNNYTTIVFEKFKTEKLKFTLFNTLGQSVRQIENISNGKIRIERNELKNGIYFFTLCSNIAVVGSGKLVIE